MSAHDHHAIHKNSVTCYYQELVRIGERAQAVLDYVKTHGPCTDRQIMRGLGFSDPNSVRPRVTELVQYGLLIEAGTTTCDVYQKQVRLVMVKPPPAPPKAVQEAMI